MSRVRRASGVAAFMAWFLLASPAASTEPQEPQAEPAPASVWSHLDRERSLLAVVTHKAGVASGLAHEHLVVASDWSGDVRVDLAEPGRSSAELAVSARGLLADPDDERSRWEERLLELGLLEGPFEPLSDRDREKIGKALRSGKQLDAERFPEIRARLLELRAPQEEAATWTARVELEVRGRPAESEATVEIDRRGDGSVRLEIRAPFRFTQWGIEPYSALLGAIRNTDELDLFGVLVLTPEPSSGVDRGAPAPR